MAEVKPESERKSEQIVIRVTKEVKQRIEAVSTSKGVKPTAFVRDLVEKGISRYKTPAATKPAPKRKVKAAPKAGTVKKAAAKKAVRKVRKAA